MQNSVVMETEQEKVEEKGQDQEEKGMGINTKLPHCLGFKLNLAIPDFLPLSLPSRSQGPVSLFELSPSHRDSPHMLKKCQVTACSS